MIIKSLWTILNFLSVLFWFYGPFNVSSAVFSAAAAENKKYEPPVPDQTAESYQIARKVDETKAELKVQLLSDLLSSHGQEEAELIVCVTPCNSSTNLLY